MGLTAIKYEVATLENQISNKKAEYLQAIANGAVHDELKAIFLEIKILNEKLTTAKELLSKETETHPTMDN